MKYKYLFFDFDGTICDTFDGIKLAMQAMIKHYNLVDDESNFRSYVGPPLTETFSKYWKTKEEIYDGVQFFRSVYVDKGIQLSKLYEGIRPLFEELSKRGYKVCVATCKKHEEAIKLLKQYGLYEYITFSSGLVYKEREDKKDVLNYAIKELNISVDDCVMIGDTVYDVEGARIVGMDCIVCLWGFGDYPKLNQDNIVYRAQKPSDILEYLINLDKNI